MLEVRKNSCSEGEPHSEGVSAFIHIFHPFQLVAGSKILAPHFPLNEVSGGVSGVSGMLGHNMAASWLWLQAPKLLPTSSANFAGH